MGEKKLVKNCITCGEDGHTYLECPTVDFLSLFGHVVGAPLFTGQSREEVIEGIQKIEARKADNE